MFLIQADDKIISAWGEYAAGPGWANQPLWVTVRDREGKLRIECIQPNEQTLEISILFKMSAVISAQMCKAVEAYIKREDKQR